MEGSAQLERQPTAKPIPLHGVTPLYGFSTDADPLVILEDVIITTASDERLQVLDADDVFVQHVRLFRPQHLLWNTIHLTYEDFTSMVASHREQVGERDVYRSDAGETPAFLKYVLPVANLLRGLQLFKPGRLVAGDTSFFLRTQEADNGTLSLTRCSEMSIDYQFVEQFSPRYELREEEVWFFLSFLAKFLEIWLLAQKYPQIEFAIGKYASETSLYGGTVELITSLEALLVPEEEVLSFRLAQRVANLIGTDAVSRKDLFRQVRSFYGVRSKLVHGAEFKKKELTVLQQLDSLREITRRVLLSVLALAADIGLTSDTYATLNDMCFDDDLRRSIQSRASALFHF